MNKTFKTLWNEARRCYIVANETQRSHGKKSKSTVALAVAAGLFSTVATAAYVEPGFVATSATNVDAAVASWETDEYKKDWGLAAMNASKAYALGFAGQNTKVAVMDSGALLSHPQLNSDRITGTHVTGQYGSTGNRYPQSVNANNPGQPYEQGEQYDVTGDWMMGVNDTHGTHVTGTVGASRDGEEFHGVTWKSDIVVGNTGATDNNNYGPYQDHDYFLAGWNALADELVAANGDRGGVINNSWGTNIRVTVIQQRTMNPNTGRLSWVQVGYLPAGKTLADLGYTEGTNEGEYRTSTGHIKTDTVQEAEYEYFYSNKLYGDKFANGATTDKSFVDAAWEAVKDKNVVQIFTTGNRDMGNPFYRPLYPYFHPEAEKQWIAVAGLKKSSNFDEANPQYELYASFNEAGLGKYWTVAAPGSGIYSSNVNANTGAPGYQSSSGTSMAAPHVAGAMGVLMSRYQDMNAMQVRDVMFTTAKHTNADGTNMTGWDNVDGTTPLEGQVSDRMGWGVPDLDKGMYGPGQFLGTLDYNMATTALDVWTNDISQVAMDQRRAEEEQWLKDYDKNLNADDYVLGDNFTLLDGDDDLTNHVIDKEDAKKWREQYFVERKAMIEAKLANGEYDGKLIKRGAGTLVMTGNNTYRGGTVVEDGHLMGFNTAFGVTQDDTGAESNGQVTVNGGRFSVINYYNDTFTMTGEHGTSDKAKAPAAHSVDVTVNAGGTYAVVADQDVNVGSLTFANGAGIEVYSDNADLSDVLAGNDLSGSVTADDGLTGADTVTTPDYALFETKVNVEGNKLTATLTHSEDATVESFAEGDAQREIAQVIGSSTDSEVFKDIMSASKDDMKSTLASLGSDMHLAARNATIVNSMLVAQTVKNQANEAGTARTATLENGATIWATGVGQWGNMDAGGASVDMDTDFYAGFIGGEYNYSATGKLGAFFGAGSTEHDAGRAGKIESDDIHFGIYGQESIANVGVSYGFAYSTLDSDSKRTLTLNQTKSMNSVNYDAEVMQLFAEAQFKGFNTEAYRIEPYAGITFMRLSSDNLSETMGNHAVKTKFDDQNVTALNIGVRGAMPVTVGDLNLSVKGDVGYTQFLGDNEATAKMTIGDAGVAKFEGEELSGMGSVSLGVDAHVGKNTTLGLSYTGAFGSDITNHGVSVKFRMNF